MIRGVTYSDGRVKDIRLKDSKRLKGVIWLNCTNLSLKELRDLSARTHVPFSELKHCLDPMETPRGEDIDNYSLIIFRSVVQKSSEKKITFPIEFIVGKNFLLTLTAEKSDVIEEMFEDFDSVLGKKVGKEGVSFLVFKILLGLVRSFASYLDESDDVVDGLEDMSLNADEKGMHNLFELKRQILFIRKSLNTNKEVLMTVGEDKLKYVKPNEYFRELHTELHQVISMEEIIRERMTTVAEISLSSTSNSLNQVMKGFTVIASVLLLPMLISGIYGMNILLPIQDSPRAFVVIIGFMIFSVIAMLLWFRSKKWV